MNLWKLTFKSMGNRKFTLGMTVFTVAISVALLLGVERIQSQLKSSFTHTVSGTDLIVGPRGGQLSTLLYSVFGLGEPTNTMSYDSFEQLSSNPQVKWAVPLAMGDSHKGFMVVGTTQNYFTHRRYADKQSLTFAQGGEFAQTYQAVIGADIARELGYQIGDSLILSHGAGAVSFSQHKEHPIEVSGILTRTGTPIDKRIFVPLSALHDIHHGASEHGHAHHEISLNAVFLGVENKGAVLTLLRNINNYTPEPLTAVLPLVAMQQLWSLMDMVQAGLMILAGLIVITTLLMLLTNMLTGLSQRQREMAILRALGARPGHIFRLLLGESLFVAISGLLIGVVGTYGLQWLAGPVIQQQVGLLLPMVLPTQREYLMLAGVLVVATLVSLVPAFRAYRMTLSQGMQARY